MQEEGSPAAGRRPALARHRRRRGVRAGEACAPLLRLQVREDRALGRPPGRRQLQGLPHGARHTRRRGQGVVLEVKVLHLGPTGHTRLGWATNMADIDMPVGCGAYGFGYREIDGAKVHMSWRERYGDGGYGRGDALGFYISLPDGERYELQVSLNNKGKPFLVQTPNKVPGNISSCFKFLYVHSTWLCLFD